LKKGIGIPKDNGNYRKRNKNNDPTDGVAIFGKIHKSKFVV
jgi:hypothetical protein